MQNGTIIYNVLKVVNRMKKTKPTLDSQIVSATSRRGPKPKKKKKPSNNVRLIGNEGERPRNFLHRSCIV